MPDAIEATRRALINHLAPGLTVPEGAEETLRLAEAHALAVYEAAVEAVCKDVEKRRVLEVPALRDRLAGK